MYHENVDFSGFDHLSANANDILAAGGAECELCGGRMLRVDGCTCEYIISNNQRFKRIKFGEEEFEWPDDGRCHDCGAMPGFYHHYNCDVEECPICGEQLSGCDCDFEYDEN